MPHRNQDPTALYILHDILRGEGAIGKLTARYGISVFAIKRHLCALRHLGVEFAHYEAGGQRIWRCRNHDAVQSSSLFRLWLAEEGGRVREDVRAA